MMLYQILIAAVIVFVFYHVMKLRTSTQKWKSLAAKVTPIGPYHSLWGNMHLISSAKVYFDLSEKLVQDTKTKLFTVWVLCFYPNFTVCHPDTARIMLKSSEPKSKYSAGGGYRLILPWIGNTEKYRPMITQRRDQVFWKSDGLLVSVGRKWERNRRLLTPAFHFDILKPYILEYNQSADKLLKNFERDMAKSGSVEICKLVSLATLDTMLKCSLSYEDGVQETGENHPYVAAVSRLAYLVMKRAISPWLYPDFIYNCVPAGWEFKKLCNYVHDFADKIIESRKEALRQEPDLLSKRRLDFLDILLTAKDECGEGLPSEDIRAEVDTFLFEGHDTTASAISWAIYALGKYPEEQEKLYAEVTEINSDKNNFEWEDVHKAHKLTAFIKEVLRVYTTVPLISRHLTQPVVLDGVEIPANCMVDINLYAAHHHPDVYPEPEKFRPERYQEDSFQSRDPFSYIPFSAGSRNCIGQNFAMNEQRVFLARILKRYKVHLVQGHIYEMLPEMTMRAKYGIKVRLEERE